MKKYLFIDRDGTLIVEPLTQQIDRLDQILLLPEVILALAKLQQEGFTFVMISNQDGLGTELYSLENFNRVQTFLLALFASQGIFFEAVRICPHLESDNCFCRKPATGLLVDYLSNAQFDKDNSYVIGDRESDLKLAQAMGIKSLLVNQDNKNDWQRVANLILGKARVVNIERQTSETNIACSINLDEEEGNAISTGIAFFDHMLDQLAKHAGISLQIKVSGDLQVDDHHTIEDTAIVLGMALKKALGNKKGIARFGFLLPMDDAQATIALDLGGRSYLKFKGEFKRANIGEFATEMVPHFFRSFSENLQAVIHISFTGENTHHMIEAIFKGVGRTLQQAIKVISATLPTTKGVI